MTEGDGKKALADCRKRADLRFTKDGMDMVASRVNPVDLNMSTVNYTERRGDPNREEDLRYVFSATAKSVFLITFDVRHLTQQFKYGLDWRIRFFLNSTLNPDYDDPVECSSMIAKQVTGLRDRLIIAARSEQCTEIEIPHAFNTQAAQADYRQNSTFTFI